MFKDTKLNIIRHNILNLTLVSFSVFLVGCYSRADEYYNERKVRLSISDAVTVDNTVPLGVGDTLVFELQFSGYLPEEGYSNLLDVFETSDSDEFGCSFGVSKFSDFSGNFEPININPEFILGTRSDNYAYYGYGYSNANMAALLNQGQETYFSKVGIILAEPGRFRLDLDNLVLSSGTDYDKVGVEIEHRVTDGNSSNTEFMVTE